VKEQKLQILDFNWFLLVFYKYSEKV